MWVRPGGRFTSVAPLLVALTAAACFVGPLGGTREAGPVPAGEATAGPGVGTDGTDTVDEFRRDILDAQRIAETYWDEQLSGSGIRFRPVSEVIAYEREGEVSCGGQPLGLNNAAYCAAGDFIAYDVNWAFGAFRKIGDAFIFYLLGHEYAHAIQIRLGIRQQFTIQQELQADCMAGAYLGDSQRAQVLRVQDGDIEEFRRGLQAVGDAPDQPWFALGAHGTARQRTQAFVNGYEESLTPCRLG